MNEDTIQRLHTYDWEQFNKERRFLQRWEPWTPYVDQVSAQELEIPEEDEEYLLDSIEDEELLRLLLSVDKVTLKIVILKMEGYSIKEISHLVGMKENTVSQRLVRLRKIFVIFRPFPRAI